MGCSLAYVSVKTSKDLPRNLFQLIRADVGEGSRRAVQLAGWRSCNLFAWHSWSRGQTDVQSPAPLCMALQRCTVRDDPLPPRISYLSGRDARRGEVTVTDAGSKPRSLCSLARGLIACTLLLLLFVKCLKMLGWRALPIRKELANANGGGC